MFVVAAILALLWAVGLATANTLNGLINLLLLAAAVLVVVRLIERRDARQAALETQSTLKRKFSISR